MNLDNNAGDEHAMSLEHPSKDGASIGITVISNDKVKQGTLLCPSARNNNAEKKACKILDDEYPEIFAPVAKNMMCTEMYGGDETAFIGGWVKGKRFSASFNRTNGCEIARWDAIKEFRELATTSTTTKPNNGNTAHLTGGPVDVIID